MHIKLTDGTELLYELAGIVTAGRHPDNMLILEDASISSHHAKFEVLKDGLFVTDLFSSNGTFANGEKVMVHKIQEGDQIRLGKVECTFSMSGAA
jgi:pSer/pThr/pTyr-binding forkhead associated (FHA) protein